MSIVASDRQWFKSAQGLTASETSREVSFCGHAILKETPLVVADTTTDPDFADNPLVTANPQIRFYAGHPLFFNGMPVGTLCLIDRKPGAFSETDRDSLATLAHFVEHEIASQPTNDAERDLLIDSDENVRRQLIDPVTQTWNESGLDILLDREIQLAVRNENEYALLSLEVIIPEAEFASMTEEEGTILLRKVAQVIRSAIRPYDFFARTGLSSLVIFCPNCDGDLSELLFDRIRARIEQSPLEINNRGIALKVHGGIAHTTAGTTPKDLLDTANQALVDALKDGTKSHRYIV